MKSEKAGFTFALFISVLVSAAATVGILSFAANAAKARIAEQYAVPDYVRYISQGYDLDTVSNKKNLLLTVTDGEKPVRVQIVTVDGDKNSLEILELPPESFIIADGFSGTLAEAYSTPVYREIIAMALCLKIDGSASFTASTLSGACQLLGIDEDFPKAEKIALDGGCYIRKDKKAVSQYRTIISAAIKKLSDLGPLEGFTTLMNLIANRVETDMSVEEMIEFADFSKDVKLKKSEIIIAPGSPAIFGDRTIWSLDSEALAELLNEKFRVKDIICPAESLGMPAVSAGEFPFEDLPVKLTDILK